MIRKREAARVQERPNMRDGDGTVYVHHLLEAEEMQGKCRLCAVLVIEPGCSIGDHPHDPDAEIFYILEGELTGTDDGQPCVLRAGDAMFTGGGSVHSVRNETDRPAKILAVVVN